MVFELKDLPDLTDYNVIVTGGNTGIGFEVCKNFAIRGANVFMASRSKERAQLAIAKLKEETSKTIEFLELDLQDLKQVKQAALCFLERKLPVDILVNNAGIMACPFALSKDGYESQFATNHLGHFQFTTTLMPAILSSLKQPRIVNLSSSAHGVPGVEGGVDFANINNPDKYSTIQRYGQSKLSNILFTHGLHARFGEKVIVNAVHPGVVKTELVRGPKGFPVLSYVFYFLQPVMEFFLLTPLQGAMSTLYAAAAPEVVSKNIRDKYLVPVDTVVEPSHPSANDSDLVDKLWKFSEGVMKDVGRR